MERRPSSADITVYQTLAEILACPGETVWLSRPGKQWPLFEAASELAHNRGDSVMRDGAMALANIPAESLGERRRRYEELFFRGARPPLHLSESLALDGRLIGPATFAVEKTYRAAGLVANSTENSDHAAVELDFLAYLLEQEGAQPHLGNQWRKIRRLFIQQHAGRWLPRLGDILTQSGDLVYAPVGFLMAHSLRLEMKSTVSSSTIHKRPTLLNPETCTLCGFCAQSCSHHALSIRESKLETRLEFHPTACVGCGRCIEVCPTQALRLGSPTHDGEQSVFLRQSPRAQCPACGSATVSQAELDAIAKHIGKPDWLYHCLSCRSLLMEKAR